MPYVTADLRGDAQWQIVLDPESSAPGFIGEVHARAVRAAGGVLAAVAGRDAESSAAAATRLLAERAASSAEELVEADDVDVVHICTPNHLHAPLAERRWPPGST